MTRSTTTPFVPAMWAVVAFFLATSTNAHGIATGIIKDDGTYYQGYDPAYQYENPPPVVIQWSTPDDLQNTFISPDMYTTDDIACHLGATPSGLEMPVKGGDVLSILWNQWPDSHKGPIIDMLAWCDGSCTTADKTALLFFPISKVAVIDATTDTWAPDLLLSNDLSWQVSIPVDIPSGNYVLRHEIIALHAAGQPNGAQNYPFCFSLAVDNSEFEQGGNGTKRMRRVRRQEEGTGMFTEEEVKEMGTLATELYNSEEVVWDLFSQADADYVIPGPPMYPGTNQPVMDQKAPPAVTATGTGIEALPAATPAA